VRIIEEKPHVIFDHPQSLAAAVGRRIQNAIDADRLTLRPHRRCQCNVHGDRLITETLCSADLLPQIGQRDLLVLEPLPQLLVRFEQPQQQMLAAELCVPSQLGSQRPRGTQGLLQHGRVFDVRLLVRVFREGGIGGTQIGG